jgi:hypothetical protein
MSENLTTTSEPTDQQVKQLAIWLSLDSHLEQGQRKLSSTAKELFRFAVFMGPSGLWPQPGFVIAAVGGKTADAVIKAQKQLQAAGLVQFSPDPSNPELYAVMLRESDRDAQLRAMVALKRSEAAQQSIAAEPKKSPHASKVTSEMIPWFVASPENMDVYLRFGAPGYGKTVAQCEAEGLRSSATDWLAFGPENPKLPYSDRWTGASFMGYFWQGAMRWRAQNNVPLTMPAFGRFAGAVKSLIETSGPAQAYSMIFTIIHHFDLIRFYTGNIGQGLIMDEGTLAHGLVKQNALQIAMNGSGEGGREWLQEAYARMDSATQFNG